MRTFLRYAFEDHGWFQPRRYGVALLDKKIEPKTIDYEALAAFYEERKTLCVTARTDRDFVLFSPARADDPPYTGKLTWLTSMSKADSSSWREEHVRQVTGLMRLLDSPFAYAAWDEEVSRKKWRLVPNPDGFGQTEVYTVRDYSDGLAGLFWRNFFGPPFIQLFGERLATLPDPFKQSLGDGLVLVQPYERPSQAGTPEGDALEHRLVNHLGPECFYNHERHLPPTRVPDLPRHWIH